MMTRRTKLFIVGVVLTGILGVAGYWIGIEKGWLNDRSRAPIQIAEPTPQKKVRRFPPGQTPAVLPSMVNIPDETLTYEQLKEKYPSDWFLDQFGSINDCEPSPYFGGEGPTNPNWAAKNCEYKDMILRMSGDEIKSFFVNYQTRERGDYRWRLIASFILSSLKESGAESKFNHLRYFILSKRVLINMNAIDKDVIENIPSDLPYYKEFAFSVVKQYPGNIRYLAKKYKTDRDIKIIVIEENLRRGIYSPSFHKKMEIKLSRLKKEKALDE